jgi:hypothetical protein
MNPALLAAGFNGSELRSCSKSWHRLQTRSFEAARERDGGIAWPCFLLVIDEKGAKVRQSENRDSPLMTTLVAGMVVLAVEGLTDDEGNTRVQLHRGHCRSFLDEPLRAQFNLGPVLSQIPTADAWHGGWATMVGHNGLQLMLPWRGQSTEFIPGEMDGAFHSPTPSVSHSAVVWRDRWLIIFGGGFIPKDEPGADPRTNLGRFVHTNATHVLDTWGCTWRTLLEPVVRPRTEPEPEEEEGLTEPEEEGGLVRPSASSDGGSGGSICQKSALPTPRRGHTGCIVPEAEAMVVFGGVCNSGYLSDTYVLDLSLSPAPAPPAAAPAASDMHTGH